MSGDLTSNLLPCPLCGCDDLETSPWPANRERSDWVARCGNPDCGCEVRAATATECAAKWNRRRSVEPPAASVIPREPSHEMMQAGLYHSSHDSEYADVHSIWVNMWDKAAGASEPPSDVQRDAERWRALIGCARVRVMGSAGLHDPQSSYAHISVEFWTHHPAQSTPEAIETILKFVERAALTKEESR